eukprot:1100441-Prymnesium_polylepis.1
MSAWAANAARERRRLPPGGAPRALAAFGRPARSALKTRRDVVARLLPPTNEIRGSKPADSSS